MQARNAARTTQCDENQRVGSGGFSEIHGDGEVSDRAFAASSVGQMLRAQAQ